MKLTLGQAARQAGLTKATLSRYVKQGKISAEKQADGSYRIDPSELDRLPDIRAARNGLDTPVTPTMKPSETPPETGVIPLEVERLRTLVQERDRLLQERERLLQDRERQIEDLRRRLDQEGEERRKITMMLLAQQTTTREAPVPPSATPPGAQPLPQPLPHPPKRRRWWFWRPRRPAADTPGQSPAL